VARDASHELIRGRPREIADGVRDEAPDEPPIRPTAVDFLAALGG
jgi:hypothetical protein